MLLPESLELDGVEAALLEKGKEGLDKVGFAVEEFGRNFIASRDVQLGLIPVKRLAFCGIFGVARENGGEMNTGSFAKEALIRQATKSLGRC